MTPAGARISSDENLWDVVHDNFGDNNPIATTAEVHEAVLSFEVTLNGEDKRYSLDITASADGKCSILTNPDPRLRQIAEDLLRCLGTLVKLQGQRDKVATKVSERDERINATRRRAESDRRDVEATGKELSMLYTNTSELFKHTRVVDIDEIEENEFNLNIPRYVDTFEPEERIPVSDALKSLHTAQNSVSLAENELNQLLERIGYVAP